MSKWSGILPRSLFLVIAAATLVLGPCFVNWYPNLRILEFSSSILAISISTAVPSCCLCWRCSEVSPKEKETFVFISERRKWLYLSTGLQTTKRIPGDFVPGFCTCLWVVLLRSFPLFGSTDLRHELQNDWATKAALTLPEPLAEPSGNPCGRETKVDFPNGLSLPGCQF